ncbi:unnamed protein product [Aureobasidium pullulans]|nr:unnamed protein product [Aureobasidium pullulans]
MTYEQYIESNFKDTSRRFVTPELLRNVDTGYNTTEIEIKEELGVDNPRKKGKAKRESKKGKKAKVDKAKDEEHKDEDIDCVGINKVLEKGPDDEDEGPKGNGGAAFDYVPSGITA